MKGYKLFKPDWTYENMKYEIGKTYHLDGKIDFFTSFHFYPNIVDCFEPYGSFNPENKVAEIEAPDDSPRFGYCPYRHTNDITLIREIPWEEVVRLVNTGKDNKGINNIGNKNDGERNTGHQNTGEYNIGYQNEGSRNNGENNHGHVNYGIQNKGNGNFGASNNGNNNRGIGNTGNNNIGNKNKGNYNIGDFNTGNHNLGSWNKTSYAVGWFNTTSDCSVFSLFNKPSPITYKKFLNSKKLIKLLKNIPFMEDYYANPMLFATQKDKQDWWDMLSSREQKIIKNMPNFDANTFYKCTGIKV